MAYSNDGRLISYENPFFYKRDFSVKEDYIYINDLSSFKPVYGSSVSFASRVNVMNTIDNSLKVLPASENNLSVIFNLNFLLNDQDSGNLLKTIEASSGFKFLKFKDPSNLYKDMIGIVEGYQVSKNSVNLNEFKIKVSCFIKAPVLNWRTSSFLDEVTTDSTTFATNRPYKKYEFVYFENDSSEVLKTISQKNKINNFWFAKKDMDASIENEREFSLSDWSKNFIFENEIPFELSNAFDIYKADYKNSFIQTVKTRENSNSLKEFRLKYTNIKTLQCKSMLFFLEKKCGYRKFIYDFPFLLKSNKVFVCTEWNHIFKFYDCHEIELKFIEDPNPNIIVDDMDVNNYYYYVL